MSRTLNQIYKQILEAKALQEYLSELDSDAGDNFDDLTSQLKENISRVQTWKLWVSIVAFYQWLQEKQDDTFRKEIEYWAAQKQVPTLKWYRQVILDYLLGKPLVWSRDLGRFRQPVSADDNIEDLRIVKYCAVSKTPTKIRIKVAGDNNGKPAQLPAEQVVALSHFLEQQKPAGDELVVVNNTADSLQIRIDVYVDPLVVNIATGALHKSPETKPVEQAITEHLLNLEFDGRFVRTYFIDTLQRAQGVRDIDIIVLRHKYAGFEWVDVGVSVVPDAGYFNISSLEINYLPAQTQ